MTKNLEFHGRTKHINIRHHFIRECVQDGHIAPKWILGQKNIANMLTKPLHRPTFTTLKNKLGLQDISKSSVSNEGKNLIRSLEPGGVLKGLT